MVGSAPSPAIPTGTRLAHSPGSGGGVPSGKLMQGGFPMKDARTFGLRFALIGALIAVLPACGQIDIPATLALDPSTDNTLTLELPAELGGGTATTRLVGNVETTVSINTDHLLTPQGVYAMIQIDDVQIAGESLQLLGIDTGTLCTALDPTQEAGGVAYLRPLLLKQADFQLTIPTETRVTNEAVANILPPIPFTLEVDASTRLGLQDLIDLVLKGTGLSIHQVIETTVPDDYPLLGGAPVTLDATLSSTATPVEDPLLDDCAAAFPPPQQP